MTSPYTTINAAITQCPKCSTAFKITAAHLASAKGAVRCGSCLSVFNARDHIQQILDPVPTKAPPATVSLKDEPQSVSLKNPSAAKTSDPAGNKLTNRFPKRTLSEELIDDDDLINDDPDDINDRLSLDLGDGLSDEFDMNYTNTEVEVESRSNLFERTQEEKQDEPKEDVDESWAEGLLDDDEPHNDADFEASAKNDTSHTDLDINVSQLQRLREEAKRDVFLPESGLSAGQSANAESGLNKRGFDKTQPVEQTVAPAKRLDRFQIVDEEQDQSSDFFESVEKSEKPFLDHLDSEPVEFEMHDGGSMWERRAIAVPVVIVLCGLFLSLIAWIQFPQLSKQEPYRSLYASACSVLGCELSPLVDRSAIRATNLVVRTHPVDESLLMVDTVLTNTAKFAQPFPYLDLVFLTESNQVKAARRLKPADYLAGELAGKEVMPTRQPVRVGLIIKDPGSDAVSYAISIAN